MIQSKISCKHFIVLQYPNCKPSEKLIQWYNSTDSIFAYRCDNIFGKKKKKRLSLKFEIIIK